MIGTEYSGRRPLSGWRDHAPEAIEAQLRWAHRAGLSFFVFDWFYEPHPDNGPLNMAFETYWKLRDRSDIQAAIAYVNSPEFAIPRERWSTAVESWVTEYFLRPGYVRIDGRPLFVILDEADRTASGRLSVLDGFQPCSRGEPVTIQQRRRGRWVDVGSGWTKDAGRYAVRVRAQLGTFRALVGRSSFRGHTCGAASSRIVATSGA